MFLVDIVAGWLGPRFAHLAKPLLIGIAIVAVALLGWAAIANHDRKVVDTHDATVNARVIEKTAPANDKAAAERATDTIAIAKQEKDDHDAIHSVPDAAPAAPTVRLGCERLRRAGKNLSNYPACR